MTMTHAPIIFIEKSPIPMLQVDEKGRLRYANLAACHLLSYSKTHLQKLTITDLEISLTDMQWQDIYQRLRQVGVDRRKTHFQTQDKTRLTLEVTASWLSSDEQSGLWLHLHDVTRYQKNEDALRLKERQFRAFFENSSTDINLKNKDGRYIMVSRQFEQHFGLPHGSAEGKLPQDIFPADFAEHVRQHDLAVMRSGQLATQEDVIPEEHGDKTLLVSKFPIFGPTEELEGIGVIATDITYLKQIEEALRASEERFRDFAQAAADFFWELDEQLRITYLSDGFEEVTGLDKEDFLGQSITTLLQQALHDPVAQAAHLEHFLTRVGFQQIEYTFKHSNSALRIVRNTGKPLYDQDNRFLGYRGAGCDVTESHQLAQELAHQANHDHLTELLNRRGFEQYLTEVFTDARDQDSEHTLCYLDLDQFKIVNDTCGHGAGDELLRQIAMLLKGGVRRQDTVARLGGDEFALFLKNCPSGRAWQIADKLRQDIDTFQFNWNHKQFSVSTSIGLASTTAAQLDSNIEQLLQNADSACYSAKEQGRNRIYCYNKDDNAFTQRYREMAWVSNLNEALKPGRFVFYMQPIKTCHLDNNAPGFSEVLLRLRDDNKQPISPHEFLSAAEHYNYIGKVDRWLVKSIFERLSDHEGGLARTALIAINISGASLSDEAFLKYIVKLFADTQLPPQRICFEITETAAITHLNAVAKFIETLKDLGCLFTLDNCGSGMSSFAYMEALPVDFIKIDGLFVRDLHTDESHFAVVEAINRISHVQKLKTIAMHVENDAIWEHLREIGVDYVQGYRVEKPHIIW